MSSMNWKNIRLGNAKSNLTGNLNVNALGNKYVSIEELVKSNIDILLLSDSKLDETFPNKQLEIQGYKTFGKDRNKHRGGVMLHVNENIPCRVLDIDSNCNDLKTTLLEFSLKVWKWLCVGLYKPPNQNEQYSPEVEFPAS